MECGSTMMNPGKPLRATFWRNNGKLSVVQGERTTAQAVEFLLAEIGRPTFLLITPECIRYEVVILDAHDVITFEGAQHDMRPVFRLAILLSSGIEKKCALFAALDYVPNEEELAFLRMRQRPLGDLCAALFLAKEAGVPITEVGL